LTNQIDTDAEIIGVIHDMVNDEQFEAFLYTLIERIDLFPERQENGSILKRIRFKFRVDYDAEAGGKVLLNENDVETVVLMTKVKK
jgi:site-specific DNA recombinase